MNKWMFNEWIKTLIRLIDQWTHDLYNYLSINSFIILFIHSYTILTTYFDVPSILKTLVRLIVCLLVSHTKVGCPVRGVHGLRSRSAT